MDKQSPGIITCCGVNIISENNYVYFYIKTFDLYLFSKHPEAWILYYPDGIIIFPPMRINYIFLTSKNGRKCIQLQYVYVSYIYTYIYVTNSDNHKNKFEFLSFKEDCQTDFWQFTK